MSNAPFTPSSPPAPAGAAIAARQRWLGVLAQAHPEDLARHVASVLADHRFEPLRAPEVGLVMLRSRIGQTGDRFNLGEATVTRCVRRLCTPGLRPTAGVGVVLGRSVERAEWVAGLDALLQVEACHGALMAGVIEPLAAATAARRHAEHAATQASRVQFFTLQAEATP